MTHLHHIPTERIDEYWPIAEPFIAKAARRYDGLYDLCDVLSEIKTGVVALWLIYDGDEPMAAMTTTELIYPKRKSLLIELVGGNCARVWYYDTIQQLAKVAKRSGYDGIVSTARKGWQKMAKDCGFKAVAVAYEMEL